MENRNKRKINIINENENEDNMEDLPQDKELDIDNIKDINNNLEDDFSEDSNFDDEIEKKINSIDDKRKTLFMEKDNMDIEGQKNGKKNKQKYDKKIMKNYFNDYFDSYKNTDDDYYEVNYPGLNKYEFKIDNYSELFKLISKKKIFKNPLINEDQETENNINSGNLFLLMYNLLDLDYNIFLYGFGNKMHLTLDFIAFYRDKFNIDYNIPLYVISCNLNNPEMNFKIILNNIQKCLKIEFEKYYGNNYDQFQIESNVSGQLTKFTSIYNKIFDKSKNNNKDLKENEKDENKSNSSEDDFSISEEMKEVDSEKDEKEDIKKNKKNYGNNLPFTILLIIHNIGSPIGQNKTFQQNLSDLAKNLYFLKLFVTCENLLIPSFWTLEVKDKYKFCYLKYDTFEPYDTEIDENNSIKMGNNIKEGFGLKEIFSSFTDLQKKLIKYIAILNLKGDHDHLTQKGLINYFVETGIGIVTDIQKLEDLIKEAIDHNIVELKISNENNKEIYMMNLEKSVIENIAEGSLYF